MTKYAEISLLPDEGPPPWEKKCDAMCDCLVTAAFLDCDVCANTGWTPCAHQELR